MFPLTDSTIEQNRYPEYVVARSNDGKWEPQSPVVYIHGIDRRNRFKQQFQQINASYNEIEFSKRRLVVNFSISAHRLRSDQTLRMPLRTFCGYHQKPAVAQRQRRPTGFSYSRLRRHMRVCKFNTRQIPQNAIRVRPLSLQQ